MSRTAIALMPTPVHRLDRLAAHLGMAPGMLLVKRDDMTGLAGGGNKARKLKVICAQAVERGCDTLVTGGGVQSNHARMTAAAAALLGLDCVLVLAGDKPAAPTGNVVLDGLLGATAVWAGAMSSDELDEAIDDEAARLRRAGRRPYAVPVGGSDALGSSAYVGAAAELVRQVPDVEIVVVATGSCGTHAGLAAGLGDHSRVVGVRVGERPSLEARVAALADAAADVAGVPTPVGRPCIDHEHVGGGYAVPSETGMRAVRLAARLEGLILDPVYTGKAMAGLMAARRSGRVGPSTRTVFLHTGGLPGVFAEALAPCWDLP